MSSEIIHEISQPLTAIAGYSDACLRVLGSGGASADELTPWLRDIDAQARRARDIINGPGVPGQRRARVFEPFVTSTPEGLEMGLALSRSIIGAHGRRLTVTDRPGGGARVRFTLPRYVD